MLHSMKAWQFMIKAVIFDWGRTLFDSANKIEFAEAKEVLEFCKARGLRLATVSLVRAVSNTALEERTQQVEHSPLRPYFELALVTDVDKDVLFDQVVQHFGLPREVILIVDDRMIRGISYGNAHGHPTVWIKKGKFAGEFPNAQTSMPTYMITELSEFKKILQ